MTVMVLSVSCPVKDRERQGNTSPSPKHMWKSCAYDFANKAAGRMITRNHVLTLEI